MNPNRSPQSLQRKVQFDLRLYFARRGMENIENMKKDHFKMEYDRSLECWKVVKAVDELTKNHKDIENIVSGVMPERKDDPLCPVQSYAIYIDHLNEENEYLWQVALRNVDMMNDKVWFGKQKMGKNPLSKFMTNVSINCELSRIYTNHCIRVTGTSILTRMQFTASEIMSVTGHKSVQSLAIYQKTDQKKKREMGDILGDAMNAKDDEIRKKRFKALPQPEARLAISPPPQQQNVPLNRAIEFSNQAVFDRNQQQSNIPPPPPHQQQVVATKPNATGAVIPFEPDLQDQQVPSFDLMNLINSVMQDEEKEENQQQSGIISTTSTTNNINNVPRSMFSNCTIGNVIFKVEK